MTQAKIAPTLKKAELTLRDFAMAYPGVHEDFPWGHRALKVKNKAFVFMATEGNELSMSMKLPSSRDAALLFPFAAPTGYGLGKSGWVSSTFKPKDEIPIEILKKWIDESYRAIAPKKLIAGLAEAPAGEPAPKAKATKKKAAKKKAAKKKAAKKKAR